MTLLRTACCILMVGGVGASGQAQTEADPIRAPIAERRSADYGAAVEAYLALVAEMGSPTPAAERHRAQLALILPDGLRTRLQRRGAQLDPGLGTALGAWWRRQDPLPSTPFNERVLEHLLRVVTAEASFASNAPTGFDARGDTFVRFGAPARRRVIDFEDDLFMARAIREEPSIRRTDFPRNEAWHYPTVGPDIYFVFVERRGDYESALPLDLLPRALLAGGLSEATAGRARLLGQALRWIYKDLHTYSSAIRERLLTLDGTVGGDGNAFAGNTGLVLQGELRRARFEDDDAWDARDAMLPASATSVRSRPFGVVHQAAVFRDVVDGVEQYDVWVGWAPSAATLAASADSLAQLDLTPPRYAIAATGVAYTPAYERTASSTRQVLLGAAPVSGQWTVVEGVVEGGHAAVEWDLFPASDAGERIPPGVVAADVLRVDSVGVGWAGSVGLSGLLPVDAEALAERPEVDRRDGLPAAQPALGSARQIAIYYELYGRRLDVEVEVEVRAVRVREGRILRPGSAIRTATTSTILVDEARIPQVALLDTGDLGQADELRVEVTVTDPATRATVIRSLAFRLD